MPQGKNSNSKWTQHDHCKGKLEQITQCTQQTNKCNNQIITTIEQKMHFPVHQWLYFYICGWNSIFYVCPNLYSVFRQIVPLRLPVLYHSYQSNVGSAAHVMFGCSGQWWFSFCEWYAGDKDNFQMWWWWWWCIMETRIVVFLQKAIQKVTVYTVESKVDEHLVAICTCICVCIHIFISIHIYICICIHIYICIQINICICICICTSTCLRMCWA